MGTKIKPSGRCFVGQIADVRKDVRDGVHHRHGAILLAQCGGDWVGVAVLQPWQHCPPARSTSRVAGGKLSDFSVAADGDETLAANRDRLDLRVISTTSSRCGRCNRWCREKAAARGLARKPRGEEVIRDSGDEHDEETEFKTKRKRSSLRNPCCLRVLPPEPHSQPHLPFAVGTRNFGEPIQIAHRTVRIELRFDTLAPGLLKCAVLSRLKTRI